MMIDCDVVSTGLVRLTNWWSMSDVWDCGMAFTLGPVFEEAYEIRAAMLAEKTLSLGQARSVAHAFCDRALLTQGMVEENMYFMGYGCQRNSAGIPNCSCVADACSSATAIADTLKTYPDSPKAAAYVDSLRRFADHVLEHHTDAAGVTSVGTLGHAVDPISQYWCACGLFAEVLLGLHDLTGERRYLEAAVAPLRFLAAFDYRATVDEAWRLCPSEVIFYAGEGIIAGLASGKAHQLLLSAPMSDSGAPSAGAQPAAGTQSFVAQNQVRAEGAAAPVLAAHDGSVYGALRSRWAEFVEWLYRNQEVTGIWQDKRDYRCYQLGLSWLLWSAEQALPADDRTEIMMDRQARCINGPQGKLYHGLFCRQFASALAHFSSAALALRCRERDPRRFEESLQRSLGSMDHAGW
jgi:hypothetical protein